MGNWNSSRWGSYRKRYTTEECLIWDVNDWAQQESLGSGRITVGTWAWPGAAARLSYAGVGGLLHFCADLRDVSEPTVRVTYRTQNDVPVADDIALELWPCPFGGWRFWFRCPLCGGDEPKRCSRLYLAPDHPRFGCRACHRLAYPSSQKSRHPARALPFSGPEYEAVLLQSVEGNHDREFFRRLNRVVRSLGV